MSRRRRRRPWASAWSASAWARSASGSATSRSACAGLCPAARPCALGGRLRIGRRSHRTDARTDLIFSVCTFSAVQSSASSLATMCCIDRSSVSSPASARFAVRHAATNAEPCRPDATTAGKLRRADKLQRAEPSREAQTASESWLGEMVAELSHTEKGHEGSTYRCSETAHMMCRSPEATHNMSSRISAHRCPIVKLYGKMVVLNRLAR